MKRKAVIYQRLPSPETFGSEVAVSSVYLGENDYAILWNVYAAGGMSTEQISRLYFQRTSSNTISRIKMAQRRLRTLVKARVLQRRKYRVHPKANRYQYVYALDKLGMQVLGEQFGIQFHVFDTKRAQATTNTLFLFHALQATDVRIALEMACERNNHTSLETWHYDRELRMEGMTDIVLRTKASGKQEKAPIVPDAVFVLKQQERTSLYFLEIDRRTTTVEPNALEKRGWVTKIMDYVSFLQSDLYKQRYSMYFTQKSRSMLPPARVLVVTTGERRLHHMKEVTERTVIAADAEDFCHWFWFTTAELATNGTLVLTEPIWQVTGLDEPAPLLPKE